MTPLEALRALPGLVERRAELRLELTLIEQQLGEVGAALTTIGCDGRTVVLGACAALDPDGLREVVAIAPLRCGPLPAEPFVHDGPVDQPAADEPELVQAESEAAPEIAAAMGDPPEPEPEIVQAPPDGGAPPEVAEPPAEPEPADDDGLLSFKRYGALCGVGEGAIYAAVTKGWIHGDAVVAGPPKRIRCELADRQVIEGAPAGVLRAGVAKRVERTVVIEAAPEPAAMCLAEAVRVLRGYGYQVLDLADDLYDVNGMRLTASRVVEKATTIRGREQRLAAARRSAA